MIVIELQALFHHLIVVSSCSTSPFDPLFTFVCVFAGGTTRAVVSCRYERVRRVFIVNYDNVAWRHSLARKEQTICYKCKLMEIDTPPGDLS
jgi:hypothetical protein